MSSSTRAGNGYRGSDIASKPLVKDADNLHKYDTEKEGRETSLDDSSVHEGEAKFKQLGWVKLTVCLIVEAIALGSLSVPSAFAVSKYCMSRN